MNEATHPRIDVDDQEMLAEFISTLADEISELLARARDLDARLNPSSTATRHRAVAVVDPTRDLATVLREAEQASASLTRHLEEANVLAAQLIGP